MTKAKRFCRLPCQPRTGHHQRVRGDHGNVIVRIFSPDFQKDRLTPGVTQITEAGDGDPAMLVIEVPQERFARLLIPCPG